jgi:hypothetical protein
MDFPAPGADLTQELPRHPIIDLPPGLLLHINNLEELLLLFKRHKIPDAAVDQASMVWSIYFPDASLLKLDKDIFLAERCLWKQKT